MMTPRNHKLLYTFLLITVFQFAAFAQDKGDVLLVNSQSFEVDAYKDIDGTPYLFDKWHEGTVYGVKGEDEKGHKYLLNFNGYTKSFEVRKDNNFIALDEKFYNKIVVNVEEDGEKKTLVFKTGLHPIYKNRFMKIVHEGSGYLIVQDFQVRLSNREKQGYAQNQNIQEFRANPSYYLVQNQKAKSFKLKKKDLIGLFKNQSSVMKSYVKKQKIKGNSEKDLLKVLSRVDELTDPSTVVAN
jgi:hypothetical protein